MREQLAEGKRRADEWRKQHESKPQAPETNVAKAPAQPQSSVPAPTEVPKIPSLLQRFGGILRAGEIVSIDKECIKIKSKSGEEMFSITDMTKFGTKEHTKTVADFKCGDRVAVIFKEEGDKKVAIVIATPVARKKAENK